MIRLERQHLEVVVYFSLKQYKRYWTITQANAIQC